MELSCNLKILVLPSFYPTEEELPRGNFFQEQTRLFKKQGLEVSVVYNELRSIRSFKPYKLKVAHFQTEFNLEENIPVYRFKGWNIIPTKYAIGRKIWVQNSIRIVKRYFELYGKPDLIHVHCALNAGLVALKIKKEFNIPYVVTEHSTSFALKTLSHGRKREALEVYKEASKVIAVSTPFKNLISKEVKYPLELIHVIPNFIDTDFFSPAPKTHNDKKVIFCVCYHERKKRLDRLILAFSKVKDKYSNTTLILGGSGPQTSLLKKLVKELNLEDHIKFPGFLTRHLVKEYLSNAEVFVLPSDVETFGVVLIEALSMGVPVIATKSGGPEDIITKEIGILVDTDIDLITEAILSILKNEVIFNPDVLRRHIVTEYSINSVFNKYLEIYNSALKLNKYSN